MNDPSLTCGIWGEDDARSRKHRRAARPYCDEPDLYSWRLEQIACASGDTGDARQPSSADGKARLDTRGCRRIGWRLGDPAGLFTRTVGLVLAAWCVATALIAHKHFADCNQEIHFLKNMG